MAPDPAEAFSVKRTFPGHVTDQLPGPEEVRLFALQPDHTPVGPLLEVLVFIKPFLGLLREEEEWRWSNR